jgi:hypothetical protein
MQGGPDAATRGAVFGCPTSPECLPTSNGIAAHIRRNPSRAPQRARNEMMLLDILFTLFLTHVGSLTTVKSNQRRFAPTPAHIAGIKCPHHRNKQAIEGATPRPRQHRRGLRSLSISTQKTVECYSAQPKSLGSAFDDRLTEPGLFGEWANDSLPLQSGAPICRRSGLPRSPFCT